MAFSPSPLQSSDDSAYLSASPSYGNSTPQTSPAGISELEQLQKQNELLLQINDQLTREKTQLQIDAELHRRQTDQNQQKQARDDQTLQDLQSQIESLHRDLSQKEYELSRMAAKLLDYKQRIDGVELQLRKYSIKKVNSFFPNRDVDMIVTKNPSNGVIMFHVETDGKRDTWPFSAIRNIGKTTPVRFVIEFGAPRAGSELFESDQADEIIRFVKDIISSIQ